MLGSQLAKGAKRQSPEIAADPMSISTVTKIKIAIEKTASKSPKKEKVSPRERRKNEGTEAQRYL